MKKRLKAAERKASILAVAKVLFSDKGYHGVSIDEIARRVGVSPAVLYRHFSSKEALYDEVLSVNSAKRESYIEAILTEPDDLASVLKRMSLIFVNNIANDPDVLRMEMMSALDCSETAMSYFERRWRSITDLIEFYLIEAKSNGDELIVNPKIAGLMYRGMLREILYTKFITRDKQYEDIPTQMMIEESVNTFTKALNL